MTNLSQKFKPISKDRLFYDQYRYCMQAQMPEASALRKLTHANIDYVIYLRRFWVASHWDKWTKPSSAYSTKKDMVKSIPDSVVQNLYKICDVLVAAKEHCRHVVSGNIMRVYTNDVQIFDDLLTANPGLNFRIFTEAVVTRAKDVVLLKNPQHQYRSYFTRSAFTDAEKNTIVNFLANYQSSIRLSPCLQRWIAYPFRHTEPYYFIDHNDTAWLVMLSLVNPGLIKKTVNITKA